jgi:hypothetical protein
MQPPADDPGKAPPRRKESLSSDGVDATLIRWMLSMTPQQRLRVLQRNIRSIKRLRSARTRV